MKAHNICEADASSTPTSQIEKLTPVAQNHGLTLAQIEEINHGIEQLETGADTGESWEQVKQAILDTSMTYQLRLQRAAKYRLIDAMDRYNRLSPGLGESFLNQVENTLQHIQLNPFSYQRLNPDVRRAVLKQFPYGIIYTVKEQRITVITITHDKEAPDKWQTDSCK